MKREASERLFAQAAAYLCGAEVSGRPESSAPGSASEARTMLLDSRKAVLKALEELEMDPMASEKFYELRKVGHEEYSVLSVLENVAAHDLEHTEQFIAGEADCLLRGGEVGVVGAGHLARLVWSRRASYEYLRMSGTGRGHSSRHH